MPDQPRDHEFVSFDGHVRCTGQLITPERVSDVKPSQVELMERARIPRGAGMSFCAASFGDDVVSIDTTRLNHIEVLNETDCTVTIEAGTPVGTLLDYLIEHGYYIPIVPGYPTITIGGCIACDVHGKNQLKDGTFVGQVLNFRIFHEDHGTVDVSPQHESQLFDLTLGGFGLTGTILSATIKVFPLPSRTMDVVTEPITDITSLPELLLHRASKSDFIISWHDFVQTGARFGSGFVQWGSFSSKSDVGSCGLGHSIEDGASRSGGPSGIESGANSSGSADGANSAGIESGASQPGSATGAIPNRSTYPLKLEPQNRSPLTLTSENRGNISLPFFSYATTGLMNTVYNHSQLLTCGPPRELPVGLCFFPSKVLRDLYFHFFGKNGLFEHQAIVPSRNFAHYIEKIRWWLSRNQLPITIASSKMFSGQRRLLRFTGNGVCFALDFPRCANGVRFLKFLDELTVEVEALPNIAKDSRLPLRVVEATYPEYERFRTMLKEFDPKRRYQSEVSRRLNL